MDAEHAERDATKNPLEATRADAPTTAGLLVWLVGLSFAASAVAVVGVVAAVVLVVATRFVAHWLNLSELHVLLACLTSLLVLAIGLAAHASLQGWTNPAGARSCAGTTRSIPPRTSRTTGSIT